MHKLEIKLKQHTPLIHFQHDQEGATLRASEVKPKLDKFIIQQAFHNNFDECKEYLVGYDPDPQKRENSIMALRGKWNTGFRALNYKISIESNSKIQNVELLFGPNRKGKYTTYYEEITIKNGEEKCDHNPFPFLISDMGGKDSIDELFNMCMYKNTTLTICAFNIELINTISQNIFRFFAIHNFGQRQTKGFGSFTVEYLKIDDQQEYTIKDWNDYKKSYDNGTWVLCFDLDKSDNDFRRQLMLFSVIDFYWRCLKSGINYTKRLIKDDTVKEIYKERYLKAYLWTYLNITKRLYTWEKRRLKNEFHLEAESPQRNYKDNPNSAVFARGMMGCPVNYEYRVPTGVPNEKGKEICDKYTIDIENYVQDPIDDNDRRDIIERIASPIIFKPYVDDTKVYVAILFDEALISKIKEIPVRKRYFKFSIGEDSTSIPIEPESIDYPELITGFNRFIWSDTDYINSLWGKLEKDNKGRKNWHPYVTVKKDGDVVSRMCCGVSITFKFIPRNFQWNNILLPASPENEEDLNNEWSKHYVHIKRIKKQ